MDTVTESNAGFRPWHFFVIASLLAATAAVLMAPQPTPEHLILISLTLAAAGLVGTAFHRTLMPLVSSNAELASEPLGRRSRAALEREKTLVLRSIKELEFDRAMGKVAEADFNEMATRLRSRAIAIMRQLEQGTSYREIVERELGARLGSAKALRTTADVPSGGPVNVAAVAVHDPAVARACTCGAANDPDARFCKACGQKLEGVA